VLDYIISGPALTSDISALDIARRTKKRKRGMIGIVALGGVEKFF
jgi:hypothetical protein